MVTPQLQMIEAGGGSIPELVNYLPEEDVAYCLVRMGFGAGRFRRNHYLFLHWASEKCPVVKRGKANAQKDPCKRGLQAADALEQSPHSLEDMELRDVIKSMVRYITVDGEVGDGGKVDPSAGITVEAFEEALKEDNAALAAEFGVSEVPEEDGEGGEGEEGEEEEEEGEVAMPVTEAVRSVRTSEEPYNWVLIGPK